MSLNRRSFLQVAVAAAVPFVLGRPRSLFAEWGNPDRILVVVQLSGGNDGLSTVVPYADDAYRRARKTLAVQGPVRLDDAFGFHPNLAAWEPAFREGALAVVQGASYPNPNRSHFESMDVWHTADLRGRGSDTGWLGRAMDATCAEGEDPNLVVSVGNALPYALQSRRIKPVSFQQPESYEWKGRKEDVGFFDRSNAAREDESTLSWLHRTAASARGSSADVRRAAKGYRPKVEYPQGRLARDLGTVAALIHGGLKTKVYYVTLGGFDTHVRQQNTHDGLMRELGDGLAAFQRDLAAQGHAGRVLTLVFSEFGRRVQENASGGTDHGVAGPMFLWGTRVKGGFHGAPPSLTDLVDGDLKMTTDFRRVYASVLADWMGTDPARILGGPFEKLALLG